jgi:hypothetical protein
MINELKRSRLHDLVKNFLEMVILESRQEGTSVVHSLDESVNGISVGLNTGDNH